MILDQIAQLWGYTTTKDAYGAPIKVWAKVKDFEANIQPASATQDQAKEWGITNEQVFLCFTEPGQGVARGDRVVSESGDKLTVIAINKWPNHDEFWAKIMVGEL